MTLAPALTLTLSIDPSRPVELGRYYFVEPAVEALAEGVLSSEHQEEVGTLLTSSGFILPGEA